MDTSEVWYYYKGLRPVVFLPNSVKVTKGTDGRWDIYEEPPVQLNTAVTPDNYGDKINYNIDISDSSTSNHIDGWEIFYASDEGTFIIAADYVSVTNTPLKTAMNSSNANVCTSGYFATYWPGESWLNHSSFDSQKSLFMYHWANGEINNNVKACADLMYTDYWKGFVNKDQGAIYAIGSPTLEMYCASWNAKGYTPLYYAARGNTGYYVGTSKNPTTYAANPTNSTTLQDKLYHPHGDTDGRAFYSCDGYWLSGPGAYGGIYTLQVYSDGRIGFRALDGTPTYHCAVRPVVLLQNTVKAKQKASGTWEITNSDL